jgi:hypothetical protein
MLRRSKLYTDVVPFPLSKATGAVTLSSDEMYPFENSFFADLDLHLVAADDADITDDLTVNVKVSYDGGSTWLVAQEYSDLANGGGDAISVFKDEALSFAPRVKVEGEFDVSGALVAGHGCAIHANFLEDSHSYRHEIATDIFDFARISNDASKTSDTVYVSDSSVDTIEKVLVVSYVEDTSKIIDGTGTGITWVLQSSYDGSNWWNVSSAAEDNIVNGTGSSFTEVEEADSLGQYFRVVLTAAADAEIEADHGIVFNMILFFE